MEIGIAGEQVQTKREKRLEPDRGLIMIKQAQNPGNIRKGLLQSAMGKALIQSGSAGSALWKHERDSHERELEIAKMTQMEVPPPAVQQTNHGFAAGSNNNFKFWLRGGAAENDVEHNRT